MFPQRVRVRDGITIGGCESVVAPKSVLTYNYGTWGLTKAQTEELDRTHRKQLRMIWNNPFKKNKDVYESSKEIPLSKQMKKARWQTLGHILRLNEETPAQKAMLWYFEKNEKLTKYPGRKRMTLPVVINEDIKKVANDVDVQISSFERTEDLLKLKRIASDRIEWKRLTEIICKHAEGYNQL